MNRIHPPLGRRAGPRARRGPRPSQSPGGFAEGFILDIAAAAMAAAGQAGAAPTATTPRRRVMTALRPPHTLQLCVHCRRNPAGLWVSRTGGTPARRPWCLSCCQELDPAHYDLIPFDGHDARGFR